MLSIIRSVVVPAFKYTSALIGNSSNVRSGFIFDKDELEMAKPSDIVDILGKDAENKPLSNAELHVKKLNKKVPLLGTAVDILFSPNTLKLLTLIGAATLIFSPLGPYVAAAGIALTLGVMAVTTVMEVRSIKNRQEAQIKSSILKETVNEHDKLIEKSKSPIFKDRPELFKHLMKTTFFSDEATAHRNKIWGQQTANQTSFLNAAAWGAGMKLPTMLFSLGVSIATLNPISIAIASVSLILGTSSAISQADKSRTVSNKFNRDMTDMRSKLGLPNGQDVALTYSDNLSELKRTNRAMDRFTQDFAKNCDSLSKAGMLTDENLAKLFKGEYLDKEPFVKLDVPKPTYASATKDMFMNGFTWSASKTSACPDNPKYASHFSDTTYENKIDNSNKLSQQPSVTKFIEKTKQAELRKESGLESGINYTHNHANRIRAESNTVKNCSDGHLR